MSSSPNILNVINVRAIAIFLLKRDKSYPITDLEKPIGLQEVEIPRISRQSAHKAGKVVSLTHRPPLPSKRYSLYSFRLKAESASGPQSSQKNEVSENSDDPIGIFCILLFSFCNLSICVFLS